ncbi:hypothetical protein, partial [Nocardia wallacei]|uniref:hypothetical protein n=1 Tax=Nocardia wallacei TaxID=480035 RepID=UPI0024572358
MSGSARDESDDQVPAWARRTAGESRAMATAAVLVTIVLQILLPNQFTPNPQWLGPGLELLLLAVLLVANPTRINREENWLRICSLVLATVLGLITAWSVDRLVMGLIDGRVSNNPGVLLGSGAAIWLTNVVVFALWYWEFDRGGPPPPPHPPQPPPPIQVVHNQKPPLGPPPRVTQKA